MRIRKDQLILLLGPIIAIIIGARLAHFLITYTPDPDYVPLDPWSRVLWLYGPIMIVIVIAVIVHIVYHPPIPTEVKKE